MRRRLLLLCPLALAILVMLPRLAFPLFGFLDDGFTLKTARELTSTPPHLIGALTAAGDTGRFFPVYWLYYSWIYWLGGTNPLWFYVANAVVLLVITGSITSFVWYRTSSMIQASSAGMLFVLSGPTLESFYTNSKQGPPAVALLAMSLLLLVAHSTAQNHSARVLAGIGMFLALLAANCTMETSVVVAGIAIAWAVSARLGLPAAGDKLSPSSTATMAWIGVLAVVAWYFLRSRFLHASLTSGTYTSGYKLEWRQVMNSGIGWASYVLRDYLYLVLLALPMLALTIRRKQRQTLLIVDSLMWMAAWTTIYLPWTGALEYYMLPFSIGCAILGGIAIGQMLDALRARRGLALYAVAGLGGVLFLMTCVNSWTNGRYQITMDRSNNELLDFLATLPPHSKVLINLARPNEYEFEISLHLAELKRRSDISVDYFHFQGVGPRERDTSYYVVTPVVKNEIHPSVRYALFESAAVRWATVLRDFIGGRGGIVFRVENRMRVVDFGLQRILCPLIASGRVLYCKIPRRFIDDNMLTYGWEVYEISRRFDNEARPAVFLSDGTWLFQSASGAVNEFHFGEPGDFPLGGDWVGDGTSSLGVYRANNKTWYVAADLSGKPRIVFRWNEMQPGDIPIAGDWNARGRIAPGYFRPRDVSWHLLSGFDRRSHEVVLRFGNPTDTPLVGDWNGDGRDTIGVYRKATGEVIYQNTLAQKTPLFSYRADSGAIPVVGKWTGDKRDSVAFVSNGSWNIRPVNCPEEPSNPSTSFTFGTREGRPLAGRWR